MSINTLSKTFIKWAGGKSQLIGQLKYPIELKKGLIKNYYEPFLGGGAVFFDIINHYPVINFYLSDINEELILVYQVIQKDVSTLIDLLQTYQQKYLSLDQAKRKAYFYEIRDKYNNKPRDKINRATQMIFFK